MERDAGGVFPRLHGVFFPEAYADIDWARGYESLDKELQQIVRDAALRTRLADKLVKVWRRNGAEQIVLIHTEIQGNRDDVLPSACTSTITDSSTATTAPW